MLENKIFSFSILLILILIIIIWLFLTIHSIFLQKRIEKHIIPNIDLEKISLLDRIISKLNQWIDCCVKKLRKTTIYEILNKNNKEIETNQLRVFIIKIFSSMTLAICYLLLSILTKLSFSFFLLVVSLFIGFMVPNFIIMIQQKIVKKQIESELLKAISIMNHSFQSGKSILQVVEKTKEELDGPLAKEFDKIYNDLLHGLSFQAAFLRFQKRVDLEEVKYIASSLVILDKTGGNIAKIFSSIEKSFYTRRKLDLELKATIASSKLVFQLLVFLPIFLWIVMSIWNPNYFHIFFESTLGILLFLIILLIYSIYIIIIRMIMKVEKY